MPHPQPLRGRVLSRVLRALRRSAPPHVPLLRPAAQLGGLRHPGVHRDHGAQPIFLQLLTSNRGGRSHERNEAGQQKRRAVAGGGGGGPRQGSRGDGNGGGMLPRPSIRAGKSTLSEAWHRCASRWKRTCTAVRTRAGGRRRCPTPSTPTPTGMPVRHRRRATGVSSMPCSRRSSRMKDQNPVRTRDASWRRSSPDAAPRGRRRRCTTTWSPPPSRTGCSSSIRPRRRSNRNSASRMPAITSARSCRRPTARSLMCSSTSSRASSEWISTPAMSFSVPTSPRRPSA